MDSEEPELNSPSSPRLAQVVERNRRWPIEWGWDGAQNPELAELSRDVAPERDGKDGGSRARSDGSARPQPILTARELEEN